MRSDVLNGTRGADFCANSIVEVGEQCDDGNLIDGDCCSAECQSEASGAPCPDDDKDCTADQCDGGGTCQHAERLGACNDGLVCTEGDTCQGEHCNGDLLPNCDKGDLNGDRGYRPDAVDLQLMVNVILGIEERPEIVARADLDEDGVVGATDLQLLINLILLLPDPTQPSEFTPTNRSTPATPTVSSMGTASPPSTTIPAQSTPTPTEALTLGPTPVTPLTEAPRPTSSPLSQTSSPTPTGTAIPAQDPGSCRASSQDELTRAGAGDPVLSAALDYAQARGFPQSLHLVERCVFSNNAVFTGLTSSAIATAVLAYVQATNQLGLADSNGAVRELPTMLGGGFLIVDTPSIGRIRVANASGSLLADFVTIPHSLTMLPSPSLDTFLTHCCPS